MSSLGPADGKPYTDNPSPDKLNNNQTNNQNNISNTLTNINTITGSSSSSSSTIIVDHKLAMPARLRKHQKMAMEPDNAYQLHDDAAAASVTIGEGMEMMPLSPSEYIPAGGGGDDDYEDVDDDKTTDYFENEHEPVMMDTSMHHKDEDGLVYYASGSSRSYDWMPEWLEDYLFPPGLPRKCQLLRPENIAVPACYLLVGLLLGLSSPLINVYPLDLGATEAQQTSISAIRSLPASFKLIFGFLSDSTPLFGYRRKSYMLLGWVVCSASYFALIFNSNLSMQLGATGCNARSQLDAAPNVPPDDAPTMAFLSLCVMSSGMGLWFSDVSKCYL